MVLAQNDVELALELKALIAQRRLVEKREKELKEYFKTRLASLGHDTANLGGVLISLMTKVRTDIDKKGLLAQYGPDFLTPFETKTGYIQVDVKELSANFLKKAA